MLHRAFHVLAATRRARALHPTGALVPARLHRRGLGTGATGVPWLDEAADEPALVRFSRAAGLPVPLPDVLGLAVRTWDGDGRPRDLMLSTTGTRPRARRFIVPRRAWGSTYSSVLSFASPAGPLLLAARADARDPRAFELGVARPHGRWHPFADLELLADPERAGDDDGPRWDPVLNPVPGLEIPPPWRGVREAAYAGSREGHPGRAGASVARTP
ncbi:hypothetical protein [Kineococcus terrestris]|uniref:hypothetical protein n=1 Tax=Kineococcus terrestris TaxID=2044856 RepID=UPI0034DAC716